MNTCGASRSPSSGAMRRDATAYAALRLRQVFVHAALFVSEEGLNARFSHSIDGHDDAQRLFAPLIATELWWWRRWKPQAAVRRIS